MSTLHKVINLIRNPTRFALIRWRLLEWRGMRKFKKMGIKIGKNTTVSPAAVFMDHDMVEIGDDCSISGVLFVTHDGGARIMGKLLDKSIRIIEPIKVGNRCVLGAAVVVKYGVTIGDDCIVAMGSVVVKDVPAGTMVGGNPAKVIGDTFEYRKRINTKYP